MLRYARVLIIFGLVLLPHFSYALDWKELHAQADKIDLAAAEAAVNKDPGSVISLYVLGLVDLNLHNDDDAALVFSKMGSLDQKSIEAKWGQAEVLRRRHKTEESEKILEGIIKAEPKFFPAYISLAYIEYRKMNFDKAIALASQVTRDSGEGVDLTNYVRALLIISGCRGMIAHFGGPLSKFFNGTQVLPLLKKAEKLQPDAAGVLFGMGSFYLLAPSFVGGNPEKAEEYLKKAIQADPSFADAYVRLAQVFKFKGDDKQYKTYLKKALKIDPLNEVALDIESGVCRYICVKGREEGTKP